MGFRKSASCVAAFLAAAPLYAATLQQLSLDDMIRKSTLIVRGKAQHTTASFRGSVIYTHYRITVSESWKGAPVGVIDVAAPGGTTNGVRQTYPGTPALADGQEYILFLWTSKTGLTQIIGLSQGLFGVTASSAGDALAVRVGALLGEGAAPVNDPTLQMKISDLRAQVARTLAAGGK
jgi:hypothetical protein